VTWGQLGNTTPTAARSQRIRTSRRGRHQLAELAAQHQTRPAQPACPRRPCSRMAGRPALLPAETMALVDAPAPEEGWASPADAFRLLNDGWLLIRTSCRRPSRLAQPASSARRRAQNRHLHSESSSDDIMGMMYDRVLPQTVGSCRRLLADGQRERRSRASRPRPIGLASLKESEQLWLNHLVR